VSNSQIAERGQRLQFINHQLISRHLKLLKKLGDHYKGEFEILDIIKFYDENARFFTDVKFSVLMPGGNLGEYTVRFNANGLVSDGVVFVVLINDKFALVKQWRLTIQQWTYEVPSSFSGNADQARSNGSLGALQISDLPLTTIVRELGAEMMSKASITSVAHLGNIAENTGTHAVSPSYFLVQIQVPVQLLDTRLHDFNAQIKVKLWDGARVRREFGRKLKDSHTITALALALSAIDRGKSQV
jgi:hypothetical protein